MKRALILLPLLLAFGCATNSTTPATAKAAAATQATTAAPIPAQAAAPAEARSELAPTGKLRVGLLVGNPIFVRQDTPPGVTQGVAVDIANELARRLDVPMEPKRYATVGLMVESAGKGEWDVAFLAIDPERASAMDFTGPYMYSENSFLVRGESTARGIEDLDKPGRKIGTFARSAQEIWLKKNAKSAEIVSSPTPAAAYELLREGKVDAVSSVSSLLARATSQVPGSRVLPSSFGDAPIGMAVAKSRPAGHAYAKQFIEQLNASGQVRQLIAREGLVGVRAVAN
jgi:polar amino acid transport system substrate-binding protein